MPTSAENQRGAGSTKAERRKGARGKRDAAFPPLSQDQRIVMHGVPWSHYEAQVALRGEKRVPRVLKCVRRRHGARRL